MKVCLEALWFGAQHLFGLVILLGVFPIPGCLSSYLPCL